MKLTIKHSVLQVFFITSNIVNANIISKMINIHSRQWLYIRRSRAMTVKPTKANNKQFSPIISTCYLLIPDMIAIRKPTLRFCQFINT